MLTLIFHPFWAQLLTSGSCSQIPLFCIPPLTSEIMFQSNITDNTYYHFIYLTLKFLERSREDKSDWTVNNMNFLPTLQEMKALNWPKTLSFYLYFDWFYLYGIVEVFLRLVLRLSLFSSLYFISYICSVSFQYQFIL